jgi:hypothetical protein
MGLSRRVTSRKAACFAWIIALARSAFAIFISSARSKAITRRLRTNMSYARRPGSKRPPPPHIPAARSANCRPPLQRETDALRPWSAAWQTPQSEAPRVSRASKNGPVSAGFAGSRTFFETRLRRSSGKGGRRQAISIVPGAGAIRSTRDRHCERSGAIRGNVACPSSLDRRVARALLAMTVPSVLPRL